MNSPSQIPLPSDTLVPNSIQQQLDANCTTCEFFTIIIDVSNRTRDRIDVDMISPFSGVSFGAISIPSGLSDRPLSTLTIQVTSGIPANFSRQLGGINLDITLLDSRGNLVTELDDPLTICLPRQKKAARKDSCLGYFEEKKSRWKCEDTCLANKAEKSLLCGETDHLTNFALLLAGNSADPCSPPIEKTLSWISLGFVIGAIVLLLLSAVVIEIHTRFRVLKQNRKLEQLGQRALL